MSGPVMVEHGMNAHHSSNSPPKLGDTQILPSQILADHLGDRWPQLREWNHSSHISPAESDTNDTGARTYATGEIGHVNLVQAVNTQGDKNEDGDVQSDDSSDELAGLSQNHLTSVTSPPFLSPTTPAVAGQKRDHNGNTVGFITRTPGTDLAAAFTYGGARQSVLGLSQVFNQTQADSSPYPTYLRSDPIFDRPSPDMRAPQTTSPHPALSSPVRFAREKSSTILSDARKAYESMKDSQDRRLQRTLTSVSSPSASDDEDELGENSGERRVARKRSEEIRNRQVMTETTGLRAPISVARLRSRKMVPPSGAKVERSLGNRQDVVVISDDVHEDEAFNVSDSSDGESIDEYDEFSQALIRSDGVEEQHEKIVVATNLEDEANIDELDGFGGEDPRIGTIGDDPEPEGFGNVRRAVSSPIRQTQKDTLQQPLRQSFHTLFRSQSSRSSPETWDWPRSLGSQTLAVLDSQPTNARKLHELIPPSHPVMPSSITSRGFLSESQGFSLSNATRIELAATPPPEKSKMPEIANNSGQHPQAVKSTDALAEEGFVGSSPPLVASSARQMEENLYSVEDNGLALVNDGRQVKPNRMQESGGAASDELDSMAKPGSQPQSLSANRPRPSTQSIPETSPAPIPVPRAFPQDALGSEVARLDSDVQAFESPNAAMEISGVALAQINTESIENFGTAQTHPVTSNSNSTTKPNSSDHSTPPRRRIRKMTDISKGLTPPPSIAENILDTSILNQDDVDFYQTMADSSPMERPVKRLRRTYGRRARQVNALPASRDAGILSPALLSNPVSNLLEHTGPAADTTPPAPSADYARDDCATDELINDAIYANSIDLVAPIPVQAPSTSERYQAENHHVTSTLSNDPQPRVLAETTTNLGNGMNTTLMRSDVPRTPEIPAIPPPPSPVHGLPNAGAIASEGDSTAVFTNRVLAKFRGKFMAYYPATCLGPSNLQPSALRIRFDDDTIDNVELKYIMHFHLRRGDVVRLDLVERKGTWTVRGFKDRIAPTTMESQRFPKVDAYGNLTVSLEGKSRQSLGESKELEIIDVPMASIYIPTNMTARFKDRFFQQPGDVKLTSRLDTPGNATSMPTTPSSRSRRNTMNSLNTATHVEATNEIFESKHGLFSNMAFAVSYSPEAEVKRKRITQLLQQHGAQILNDGFDELFDVPNPQIVSPSKNGHKPEMPQEKTLTVAAASKALGFTALITDVHSRRAKYMQALALNLPCLSGQWVVDSADHGKILPWDRYLLPAGESAFLDGAVRSRTFSTQLSSRDPAEALLCRTVEQRPKMLAGKNVMLIIGEGKADEKRKAYVFLTLALGAERVQRVKGISAAKAFLEQDASLWNWVYVGDAKLQEAARELRSLVRRSREASRKRSRIDSAVTSDAHTRKKPMLVGDEFVVQSLILGTLLEDE